MRVTPNWYQGEAPNRKFSLPQTNGLEDGELTLNERFMAKVKVAESGCWHWTAYKNPRGYGQFNAQGRTVIAHRWSYEMHVGPIPDGLCLDHLCRVRHCVNPDHLEPVTNEENLRRARPYFILATQGRDDVKERCVRGHEYSQHPPRMYRGHLYCRACDRERTHAKYWETRRLEEAA